MSNTWNESNANPCWVDSGVESIKEEDAIGSDRVQKPCFDSEWDIYLIYLQMNMTSWPHIEPDPMYAWRDYGSEIVIWSHGENDV